MVTLHHPKLPGRSIDVRPEAVKHWTRCGWTAGSIEPKDPAPDQVSEHEPSKPGRTERTKHQ